MMGVQRSHFGAFPKTILLLSLAASTAHGEAQDFFGPPGDATPQRMCVGSVKDGELIGWSMSREPAPRNQQQQDAFNWYRGDLASGKIRPMQLTSEAQTGPHRNRTNALIRRWRFEGDQLWFAIEAMYGPTGPGIARLYRTRPICEEDPVSGVGNKLHNTAWDPESRELTETVAALSTPFDEDDVAEQISLIEPLRRSVNATTTDRRSMGGGSFFHCRDGFDFIPRSDGHWTFFMTAQHIMQIWDCHSERVPGEVDAIRNKWKLDRQLWLPWRGPFFVVEVKEPNNHYRPYVVVRDSGEVYCMRVDRVQPPLHAPGTGLPTPDWNGIPLLDPVDYLVALLYVEPENAVYGFGPNFYVRLDASMKSAGEKTTCRHITRGNASWTDDEGNTHELEDPFRTIWQCAKVLKEDGVLD